MKSKLAIVIPAYNSDHLSDLLNSLSTQSNKNFKVYIGDDYSPNNLSKIVDKYKAQLDIHYSYFNKNLGKEDLIKNWNRTVKLSHEDWVWLIADDDLVDKNCVEKFYNSLSTYSNKYLIYRFNTRLIDSDNAIIDISPPHAETESAMEVILPRVQGNRHGCISNFIVTRKAFDQEDGFINFPAAWYSDDASIAAFSDLKDIFTISGPRVGYRRWSKSLSYHDKNNVKVNSLFLYIEWVNDRYRHYSGDYESYLPIINKAFKNWMIVNIIDEGGVPLKKLFLVSRKFNSKFDTGTSKAFVLILLINVYTVLKFINKS